MSEQDVCVKRTITIPKELRDIIGDDDEEYNRIKHMNEEHKKAEHKNVNDERMSLRGYIFYIFSYMLFPCLRIYAFLKYFMCCEWCDCDICNDGIYGYIETEDDDGDIEPVRDRIECE